MYITKTIYKRGYENKEQNKLENYYYYYYYYY